MHFLVSRPGNGTAFASIWLAIEDLSTRSSTVVVLVTLGLIGLVAMGVLYYRNRQLRGAVDEQFRGFREKAVALMDQIDGLRKRHKTLPSTDPDFTAPMTGATLALYNRIEHDLDGLWNRWLEIMEIWNQAERQIRAGSGLTANPTEEARKLIEQGGVDTLLRQSSACRQDLDRLNQVHEQAREALAAGRAALDAIRDAHEPSDRYDRGGEIRAQVERSERMYAEAERQLTADPIGAQELMLRARRSLELATSRPQAAPRLPWEGHRAYHTIDDLAAAFHQLRSAAARLQLSRLVGVFVRGWMLFLVFALFLVLFIPFLPLIVFLLGFLIVLAGFWTIWRIIASWFWFGMWQLWR